MGNNTGATPEYRWFSFMPLTKPEIIGRKIRKEQDPAGFEDVWQCTVDLFSICFMQMTYNMHCKNRIKRVILKRGTTGICNHNMSV
jgi:hypothetical protein